MSGGIEVRDRRRGGYRVVPAGRWRVRKRCGVEARDQWRHRWGYARACPESRGYPDAQLCRLIRSSASWYYAVRPLLSPWQRRARVRGQRAVRIARTAVAS